MTGSVVVAGLLGGARAVECGQGDAVVVGQGVDPSVPSALRLAGDRLTAVACVRARVRRVVWSWLSLQPGGFPWLTVAGKRLHNWVIVDMDATIITAASKKEQAPATWKKTFGFHPLATPANAPSTPTGPPAAAAAPHRHARPALTNSLRSHPVRALTRRVP
ncbi:hypothetical protein ACFYPT_40365 [Streptomyces sp. NPDC005529]|uniref:hypothetical protein n=1 Tax=unclassified Streptomyces TaxID=2593676 RepID=UPI0033B91CA4